MKNTYLFLMGLFLTVINLQAQKKSLTPDDFDQWKIISGAQLSPDGNYLVYQLRPGMGDQDLVIKNLKTNQADTIARGGSFKFSGDGSYVAFNIDTPLAIRRKEETKKTSKKKRVKDSLGIYVLATGKLTKYPMNHGFDLPEEGSAWMTYKTMVATANKANDSLPETEEDSTEIVPKKRGKAKMDTLLLALNPVKGDSLAFKNIDKHYWAKKNGILLMATEEKDSTGKSSALMVLNTLNTQTDTIFNDAGTIEDIVLDEQGNQVAFLYTTDTTKIKNYALMTGPLNAINPVAAETIKNLPQGWSISKNSKPFFSENGKKLFFGTSLPEQEITKDTLLNREREKVDIWSWTDKELQPMQLLNKSKEAKRTYRAVYDTESQRALQLADSTLAEVRFYSNGDARYALGVNNDAYTRAMSWSGLFINDFYLVDTETGERKSLATAQPGIDIGPDQNYALLYNRKDSIYYGIDLKTGDRKALTADLEVDFFDEQHDTPSEPRPYGVAGWSEDDKYVFVYDRFDIWRLDPSGKKAPVNMTRNGRDEQLVYRYRKLDREEEYIDLRKEIVLTVFNENTKEAAFGITRLNKARTPQLVLFGDHDLGLVTKAKEADKVLFTKARFETYPDLWISSTSFRQPVKVTNAGKQLDAFKWGSTRLVSWKGYDGSELQGVLYLPENMEAGRKYPMVTYFYERSSDRLNNFVHPSPSRSTVNKAFYVSNDYVVFMPDIVYRDGYPGQSAYDCIVSGVEAMVAENDFIDGDKVALQGQSWGGYQTAYLITQTDRFAAAMAGAPVSNMTSAYGGIRWGSGMSRMFQYERTQSRLGVTLWDNRELYLENSPLFYADKVNTPLLMMHNDEDGAVPWYQGIEYFVALRRLDKPVWLLNYNGMPHNLSGSAWGNRKDLSVRMMQFFDHYLKGEQAPEWMVKGRPAIEKETNKAY